VARVLLEKKRKKRKKKEKGRKKKEKRKKNSEDKSPSTDALVEIAARLHLLERVISI
tara:strand:+ start:192 stop:362 length:171 start_codon:yes stop_codon:yes gene_type:complete